MDALTDYDVEGLEAATPSKQYHSFLETLADWVATFGFDGQWLSNQLLVDIALDGGFEEIDENLHHDCLLDNLDAAFKKSRRLVFGRWEGVCRNDVRNREYLFVRKKNTGKRKRKEGGQKQ